MCTVSYFKNKDEIVFTSNRDESIKRLSAKPPTAYQLNGTTLFYPKDEQSGGTWFCVNQFLEVIILLNGAITKHIHQPPYARSRGNIPIELFLNHSILEQWFNINLLNIEPFTLVVFTKNKLYQLQWNGITKTKKQLNTNEPKIWSSCTLYTDNIIDKRQSWFSNFLLETKHINKDELWKFHTTTNLFDKENGLLINRNNTTLTRSITQFVITKEHATMYYYDVLLQKQFELCVS